MTWFLRNTKSLGLLESRGSVPYIPENKKQRFIPHPTTKLDRVSTRNLIKSAAIKGSLGLVWDIRWAWGPTQSVHRWQRVSFYRPRTEWPASVSKSLRPSNSRMLDLGIPSIFFRFSGSFWA